MAANSPSLSQRVSHACISAVGVNWRVGVGLHQRVILASERMGTAHVVMRSHPLCAIFFGDSACQATAAVRYGLYWGIC